MKANELMLGDWVETPDYVTRVETIGPHAVLCEGIVRWLAIQEVQPVPLTPEILEKNGFEYNDMPFVMGWEQFGLTLYHGGDGYLINCGQNVAMKINAVHELQHALRLCGVEKEIVL